MIGFAGCTAVLLAGFAASNPAWSQDGGLTVLSQGESFAVRYGPGHRGNLAGGAAVETVTGGEAGEIRYASGATDQALMIPVLVGGGESQSITYSVPVSTGTSIAAAEGAFAERAEAVATRRQMR